MYVKLTNKLLLHPDLFIRSDLQYFGCQSSVYSPIGYAHISLFMTIKSKYPTVFVEAHGRTLGSCLSFFYAMYQSGSLYSISC